MGSIRITVLDISDDEMTIIREAVEILEDQYGIMVKMGEGEKGHINALEDQVETFKKLIFESDWIDIQRGTPYMKEEV